MLVKRAKMIEIECVARGYISGSGWKEYKQQGTVCGIRLPAGLRESDKLPEPIFTPSTKAQSGHDENVSFETVVSLIGEDLARRLRELTLSIYSRAAKYAETRGIIIADTKFEFGFVGDELVLGDEVLTPDSSRFWPAESYQPGGRNSPSTSNSCAITWNRFTGISSRRRRLCRRKSPSVPAKISSGIQSDPHRPRIMNWLDVVLLLIIGAIGVRQLRRVCRAR
jgi:phosphoribosylaminoimidazole-succinocarboxamide synthase